jgi:hypothetical protein
MELPSGLFAASKGKDVEVVVTGRHDPIVGTLESVGADFLELRDEFDDVWVNLSAVVSVWGHARVPPAGAIDSKSSSTTAPKTREVALFCEECGYDRIAREPVPEGEKREPGTGPRQATYTCPACGCTSWTYKKPQP